MKKGNRRTKNKKDNKALENTILKWLRVTDVKETGKYNLPRISKISGVNGKIYKCAEEEEPCILNITETSELT